MTNLIITSSTLINLKALEEFLSCLGALFQTFQMGLCLVAFFFVLKG